MSVECPQVSGNPKLVFVVPKEGEPPQCIAIDQSPTHIEGGPAATEEPTTSNPIATVGTPRELPHTGTGEILTETGVGSFLLAVGIIAVRWSKRRPAQ